jgi:hypothetical protein
VSRNSQTDCAKKEINTSLYFYNVDEEKKGKDRLYANRARYILFEMRVEMYKNVAICLIKESRHPIAGLYMAPLGNLK